MSQLPSNVRRLRMGAKLKKEEYETMCMKNRIKGMHWGVCCGKRVMATRRNVDIGGAIIKNVPVGVCETCGNEYHNIFFMADLEEKPVRLLEKILGSSKN